MNKKIRQLIQSTLHSIDMEIRLKHERSGINMSYNFILHYIGYDVRRINLALKELEGPVTLDSYIKTFTLHEAGHALDRKALLDSMDKTIEYYEMKKIHTISEQYSNSQLLAMRIDEHEMNIQFEESAWSNAEDLNKKYGLVEWNEFKEIKSVGLKTYWEQYAKDLDIYSRLMSESAEQIA